MVKGNHNWLSVGNGKQTAVSIVTVACSLDPFMHPNLHPKGFCGAITMSHYFCPGSWQTWVVINTSRRRRLSAKCNHKLVLAFEQMTHVVFFTGDDSLLFFGAVEREGDTEGAKFQLKSGLKYSSSFKSSQFYLYSTNSQQKLYHDTHRIGQNHSLYL